jgi:hypothetical protein
MYSGGLLYLIGMSPALGSHWGLLVFAGTVPVLIWRLLGEEKLLARNLPGTWHTRQECADGLSRSLLTRFPARILGPGILGRGLTGRLPP